LIGLDAALKGRGKDFDRTLRHSSQAFSETANLLAQVNSDGQALSTIVAKGSQVTSALASSQATSARPLTGRHRCWASRRAGRARSRAPSRTSAPR